MKPLQNLVRMIVGNLLAWGVFAPLFFFLMFAWFTPKLYFMRARAKRDGSYGTATYRRSMTDWQANCSHVYTRLFETIMFMTIRVRVAYGPKIVPGQSHIIIANHISWFDTVYFPGLCARLGLKNVRYVVKKSFSRYRLAYYVLTITWDEAGFPAVTRVREKADEDIRAIEDGTRLALSDGASMLIFCEGTRQPDAIIGKPKWRGFAAQEKIFQGCRIASITQCLDEPVGPTIWSGYSYFGRIILFDLRVFDPLAVEIDRQSWLEREFERKGELIRSIRR